MIRWPTTRQRSTTCRPGNRPKSPSCMPGWKHGAKTSVPIQCDPTLNLSTSSMKHWTMTLLIVAVACGCADFVSAAERPNILLIVSEDNGPELGCYGDSFVKTHHR